MKGYGFPVTRQLFLGVRVYPIVSARSLQLNALFMDRDGKLIPSVLILPTTTAGTMTETEFQCIDGYLVSLTISDRLGTAREGEAYCQAFIKMGQVDTDAPLSILSRGFVFENSPIYYPGGKDLQPTDGNGLFYHASGVAPGAGNEYSLTFDAWESFVVLGVSFVITTSAVAANRRPYVLLSSDVGNYQIQHASSVATASKAVIYQFTTMGNYSTGHADTHYTVTMRKPQPFEYSPRALAIGVHELQVADSITSIVLTLAKYPDLRGF